MAKKKAAGNPFGKKAAGKKVKLSGGKKKAPAFGKTTGIRK